MDKQASLQRDHKERSQLLFLFLSEELNIFKTKYIKNIKTKYIHISEIHFP